MIAVGTRAIAHHPARPAEDYEVEVVESGRCFVKVRRTGFPVGSIAATIRTYTRRPGGKYAERGAEWPVLRWTEDAR